MRIRIVFFIWAPSAQSDIVKLRHFTKRCEYQAAINGFYDMIYFHPFCIGYSSLSFSFRITPETCEKEK
jgi:hypothetical protein